MGFEGGLYASADWVMLSFLEAEHRAAAWMEIFPSLGVLEGSASPRLKLQEKSKRTP